ncbi:MAG: aldo/keto reductase [Chitinophagales bacterium]
MIYNNLGRTGLRVSALSLGSWLTFGNQITDDVAEKLMVTAYNNGINFFDNAETYAQGKSELVMGKILKKLNWDRSTYIVSSKVFWGGQLPNQKGLMRKHVVEACEAALKRLQVDYLDLFFCHRPDIHTPIEETVRTMQNLIQQGKILYWGTSEWTGQQITEAHYWAERLHATAPVMEQPQYNLFEREKLERDYLPLFKTFGLGTTIWSPLASGLLTGKYLDQLPDDSRLNRAELAWLKDRALGDESKLVKVNALQQLAKETGISLVHLALCWCLANPHVSTVILGASRVEQLEENLKCLDHQHLLTPELLNRIEAIMQNKPTIIEY